MLSAVMKSLKQTTISTKMKPKNMIKKNFIYILFVVLILIISRFFSIGLATGESMYPTITSPSILFINKSDKDFHRNDVVVCKKSGLKAITKRIIGLPGETITISEDGKIFINHIPYEDKYGNVTLPLFLNGDRHYPITLADDEYFVMGDNRNVSADSRNSQIGNIHKKNILGKVMNHLSFRPS